MADARANRREKRRRRRKLNRWHRERDRRWFPRDSRIEVRYFDRKGKPIDEMLEWAARMEKPRHVAHTSIRGGDLKVSTVWLGIDYSFGRHCPPLIFETMVFTRPRHTCGRDPAAMSDEDRIFERLGSGRETLDGIEERYSTAGAAKAMHRRICRELERDPTWVPE